MFWLPRFAICEREFRIRETGTFRFVWPLAVGRSTGGPPRRVVRAGGRVVLAVRCTGCDAVGADHTGCDSLLDRLRSRTAPFPRSAQVVRSGLVAYCGARLGGCRDGHVMY
ncbi:hypothetical protein [Saccharopolyspora halophila]|uniref:hypothetical protein n=1 Tax=Saccharopolyspora halophila TaxID=405551 RepID=UPI0031E23C7C